MINLQSKKGQTTKIKHFMQNPQKISAFRVTYRKKQTPITASYLRINRLNLSAIDGAHEQVRSSPIHNQKSWFCDYDTSLQQSRVHAHARDRNLFESPKINKGKYCSKVRSLSTESRNKQQLRNLVKNLIDERRNAGIEQPIHSRKTERFKILAGTLKKNRSLTCQTIQTTKMCSDAIRIKRETIHDFNDYSLKYINNLQKQAARVVKTAQRQTQRNHLSYKSSQMRRKPKMEPNTGKERVEVYRPWSRQKFAQLQEQEEGLQFF